MQYSIAFLYYNWAMNYWLNPSTQRKSAEITAHERACLVIGGSNKGNNATLLMFSQGTQSLFHRELQYYLQDD